MFTDMKRWSRIVKTNNKLKTIMILEILCIWKIFKFSEIDNFKMSRNWKTGSHIYKCAWILINENDKKITKKETKKIKEKRKGK